jgi:hypothetical protein
LVDKGYVVIRSFLEPDEVALFESDIPRNEGVWYEAYLVKIPPRNLLLHLSDKLDALTAVTVHDLRQAKPVGRGPDKKVKNSREKT